MTQKIFNDTVSHKAIPLICSHSNVCISTMAKYYNHINFQLKLIKNSVQLSPLNEVLQFIL